MEQKSKKINAKKTALVLQEFQNDFLATDGKFYSMVKGVTEKTQMLQNTVNLIGEARKKGIKIFHAPIQFSKNYVEMGDKPFGILKIIKELSAFQKGTKGVEIFEEINIEDGDIIVDGKSSICAFSGTNLDHILRSFGIEHIALAGYLSHICVDSTMRTGYEKGYDVITLTDCTSTLGEQEQQHAIENSFPMFSTPMTHIKFIQSLN